MGFNKDCVGPGPQFQEVQYGNVEAAAQPYMDAYPGYVGGNTEEEGETGKELASEQDIPFLAAKFAVSSGVVEPVDNDLAKSTTYLIAHSLEEKMFEETASIFFRVHHLRI